MKKFIATGLMVVLGVVGVGTINSAKAVEGYSSYWEFYRSYYGGEKVRTNSSVYRPSYRSTYQAPTRPTTGTSASSRRSRNYRVYPTNRTRSESSQRTINVVSTPITLSQDINSVSAQPIDLFNIGVSHKSGNTSGFSAAALVSQMQFQMVDNSGGVSDFSDFDLVVEDQNFQFERNGYITLKFNNLRLARGESRNLKVQIKLNNPDNFVRSPGSFRVKLVGVKAVAENTVSSFSTKISGRTVSDYVVLNPSPSVSGGASDGTAGITPVFVSGKALGAGDRAVVLRANLKASLDDFLVEKVTVRNTYGDNVDAFIQEVRLINKTTGTLLSTKRFINGIATFKLSRNNQVFIGRNNEVDLVFEVLVRDNLPSSITDNRLELSFNDSDIDLYGVGSGRNVPDSRKNFNVEAQTFTVTQGRTSGTASGGISFSETQPSFVTTGTLEQVARFQIRNSGARGIEIGRLSTQVSTGGVEFSGGISIDDATIVRIVNGFQEQPVGFTTVSAVGNTFVFDMNSRLYIAPGSVQEFALKLKLDNTGAFADSDSVAIKILGDSSFSKDSLSGVRSSGAHYIWSDLSASPHTTSSTDWFSGYLVSGLPTANFVRYRR